MAKCRPPDTLVEKYGLTEYLPEIKSNVKHTARWGGLFLAKLL